MPEPTLIEGSPPALPGNCYVCHSADRERWIDWKINIEFHGAFYICDECLIEVGRILGMLTPVDVQSLEAKLLSQEAKLQEQQEELDALRKLNDGLDAVNSYINNHPSADQPTLIPREDVLVGAGTVAEREDGPAEPSNDEGMAELRSTKRSASSF